MMVSLGSSAMYAVASTLRRGSESYTVTPDEGNRMD